MGVVFVVWVGRHTKVIYEVVNDKLAAADLKRFCTVLYSVAARTDGETCEQPSPFNLYKGAGNIKQEERDEYPAVIEIGFTNATIMTGEHFASKYATHLTNVYNGEKVLQSPKSWNERGYGSVCEERHTSGVCPCWRCRVAHTRKKHVCRGKQAKVFQTKRLKYVLMVETHIGASTDN